MYVQIEDLRIYYQILGQGSPIVMIHGMGVDQRTMSGCMEPVFQRRSGEWKRIYFDLPGMGQTNGVDWIENSDDMLQIVLEFVDTVSPDENFLLVGESYGGYLARAVIRERPESVDGMLLIGPLAVADDAERDLTPRTTLQIDRAFVETLTREERAEFDLFAVLQNERTWKRYYEEMGVAFAGGDHAFKQKIRQLPAYQFTFDVDDLPAPFEKPSLVVTGRQDCLAGYRDSWNFLENYPRCTFVVLDVAGHALQIEQEALFNALVDEWLDRVQGLKS